MSETKYIHDTKTGRKLAWSPWICPTKNPRYIWLENEPVNEVVQPEAPKPVEIKAPPTGGARKTLIRAAVELIDRNEWTSPRFGRPGMPLVKDVEAVTGFQVSAEEVAVAAKAVLEG